MTKMSLQVIKKLNNGDIIQTYDVMVEVTKMLAILINGKEEKELEYLLKRELEELLFDLQDSRIDNRIKHSMEERYQLLFRLFQRVAPPSECLKYIRRTRAK